MKRQKLPISTTDFKVLREDRKYYIDKTLFAKELLDASADVILLPRPRRFGKTLNLSMLRYFFEDGEEKEQVGELFQGLAISKIAEFKNHFGKYPVIWMTFKDIKEPDLETALYKIYRLIRREFGRHAKKIKGALNRLENEEVNHYKEIRSGNAQRGDFEDSIGFLSKLLFQVYGQKCIILIDEYDTPIQNAYIKGYFNDMIGFFKPFLGAALKGNDTYLKKAVLTGVLRISKESIFSDLNNLEVNTLLNDEFSDRFGFTVNEVKRVLMDYRLSEKFDEVFQWYNGYKIGETIVLNPWSIINYANRKKFDVYWANTSSNKIIQHLAENSNTFKDSLEVLLTGGEIEQTINPNIVFGDLEPGIGFREEMLYSFLFFSGYLKYSEKRFEKGKHICRLSIANLECQYIFEQVVSNWIEDSFNNLKLKKLLESLIRADLKIFERIFSEFVRDTLSFFDTAKNVESVYHAFLLGLLVNLAEYEVISNREAGYGRVDIMLLHKTDKTRPAIVMELKTIDEFAKETKNKALEKAVRQIEDRKYETDVRAKGYPNIVSFGVVFDGKRVWTKTLRPKKETKELPL